MHACLKWSLLGVVLAVSACVGDTGNMPDDAGPSPDVEPDLGEVHLNIVFDYRFDEAGFFDARKKDVLEAAAASWGRILADDFESVPAGTPLLTRDPQRPDADAQRVELDDDIDDIVVFVGAATLDGIGQTAARSFPTATFDVGDDTLGDVLQQRTEGDNYEPWSGWITFDADEFWFVDDTPYTDDDVDGQVPDLYTNAMHELGHILGVGTAPAYFALVDDVTNTFTGASATAVLGEPVPVTGTAAHLEDGFDVDGEEPLMNRTDVDGSRVHPTPLDIAILQDIGYELVE